jgi:ADP-heptose:LPS heptosyltransferase
MLFNMAGKSNSNKNYNISNLDVMLSMDSGNAHIAAMLGVNYALGRYTSFCGFLPFNQREQNALVSDSFVS